MKSSTMNYLVSLLLLSSLVIEKFGAVPIPMKTATEDGKFKILEGDILLDSNTKQIIDTLIERTKIAQNKTAIQSDALVDPASLWPKGKVPYAFGRVGQSVKNAVNAAIKDFHAKSCVRFHQRTTERNYIEIVRKGGCWSSIGRSGGKQELSLGFGCQYKGIAIHELMHAIGFYHEQSRLDRDNYVIIKWENIRQDRRHNFAKYVRGRASTYGEPYDYGSIMHYPSWAFSINKKPTIVKIKPSSAKMGQRKGFSQIDIAQVNKLYRCVDIDECALFANGKCQHICINTPKSYTCSCKAGFELYNKYYCRDIDECSMNLCDQNCKNTKGSYICSCRSGFRLNADGRRCNDINECLTNNGGCEHHCWNYPPGKSLCLCKIGYSLKPDKKHCQDIDECALNIGGCTHFCKNTPGSYRCSCKTGYYLTADGNTCHAIRCGSLPAPSAGKVTCIAGVEGQGSYQSRCNITCAVGHTISGSTSRTCASNGKWTGTETKCEPIRCPALKFKRSGALVVFPTSCADKHRLYNQYCMFGCKHGYKLIGSPFKRCDASGKWVDSKIPSCRDVERPIFKVRCPANIYKTTEPQKSYAVVSWVSPKAEDNSKQVKLLTQPMGIRQPHRFPIGETKVTYTAIDPTNNTRTCSFTVSVHDNEKPNITCPRTITILPNKTFVRVRWPTPNITDNSGQAIRVDSTKVSGVELTYGKHVITYQATDMSNNTRICSFNVIILKKSCKPFPHPINGETKCDGWKLGSFCTVSCKKGYKFTKPPSHVYVCGVTGHWLPNDNPPPCSV